MLFLFLVKSSRRDATPLREVTGDYTSPLEALVETECGWLVESGIEFKGVVQEPDQKNLDSDVWSEDLTP